MSLRTVIVIAGPTGPTGTYERVNIYNAFTGSTGLFEQCRQATGPTGASGFGVPGQFALVYPSGGPTAGVRNVIIAGYVGPTGPY